MALGLLAFTTGCPTVDRGGAQTFSTGVTAARARTKTTFDAVVGLTRTSAIEYAVKQDRLTEEELVAVPNSEAVAAWNEALDPVESYAQHLASLVADAILTEAQEVFHRINPTQNLLFVALNQELTAAVAAVETADVRLKQDPQGHRRHGQVYRQDIGLSRLRRQGDRSRQAGRRALKRSGGDNLLPWPP
jgi:anion-transporting  ArsA/GET3 family ATPase